MIYPKNSTIEIYSNATGLTDKQFMTSVYLSELATLIKDEPQKIISALKKSDFSVSKNPTRREITNTLVDGMFQSPELRNKITNLLAKENAQIKSKALRRYTESYSGTNGSSSTGANLQNTANNLLEGGAAGAQAGGPVTAVVGVLAGLTESIFDWKASENNAEVESNKYKLEILNKISGGDKKNYVPLIIIGGVLLVGTIVLIFALRK
tara:strand:- start:10515 stop:11141 length:627 start_codon:yes stop_codon:yes gene_type:complete